MANSFITPTWVLKDVARVAVNNLKFAANIERWYDDKFKVTGAKVGYTVSGRLPQRFRREVRSELVVADAHRVQAVGDVLGRGVPSIGDGVAEVDALTESDAEGIEIDVVQEHVRPSFGDPP